jgi:aerobic-type carbon monoxide dehydrogenase small subunit (CoxS/CutS family)
MRPSSCAAARLCTPGFLLSAYDLLTHKPQATQEELAVELPGAL